MHIGNDFEPSAEPSADKGNEWEKKDKWKGLGRHSEQWTTFDVTVSEDE